MRLSKFLTGGLVAAVSAVWGVNAMAADTIKIGDINSYKRLPAHTIPYKKGTELAIDMINNAGGVLGKKLEIVSRDDQGKPGEAVKIAEELFTRDGVVMISGSLFSHIGLALTSYAGQNETSPPLGAAKCETVATLVGFWVARRRDDLRGSQ